MAWKRRTAKHAWRDYLTKEEAAAIDAIDRDAQKIDGSRLALTAKRNLIVNRAIQRAQRAKPR